MNMSLLIPLLFLVVITLFILFFKKNRKRFRPKDDKIATPSKEEINLLLTTRISYDFELPGGFSDIPYSQIIYMEQTYNPVINAYIQANLTSIQEKYAERSCKFIYLPCWVDKNDLQELAIYNSAQSLNSTIDSKNITLYFTRKFFDWIGHNIPNVPVVISISRRPANGRTRSFVAFPINDADMESFFSLHAYISIYPHDTFYQLIPEQDENAPLNADEYFSSEAQRLMHEIRERISRLQAIGFCDLAIKALVPKALTSQSRLQITKDFRILLTDYDNTEITMTPLPKAVFILFLKHPEGILFKELPQYRGELLEIYKRITNRENIQDIVESIEQVTNPQRNSINEKCSRIREAFIAHFDESLMKPYFITGERGQTKKIALDRALVIWELE